MSLTVLDLFSGIGGFSLGLERTGGFRTIAFCEIDPFCRRVLAKHWPEVPCYDDVRELTAGRLAADGLVRPDVICGGFPCQDISVAGKGAGIEGARSGLWREYARLVGELRPSFVIVENVSALRSRGMGRVLGDLAALGYDAEWHCIPASAVGAPHRRDRVWIVAHAAGEYVDRRRRWPELAGRRESANGSEVPHPAHYAAIGEGIGRSFAARQWRTEPDVGRVAHGVPARVDRLRSLGNAVVPQIPELIGRAILSALAEQREAA